MPRQTKNIVKKASSISRDEITLFLDRELRTTEIRDSSCNGLQVQGAPFVSKIGLAVDACIAAYEQAVEKGCGMLIAHHGIIWDGLRSITGKNYKHVKFLLDHDLNLYASHLPLDLHPKLGNNAGLAAILGLGRLKPFGNYKGTMIGFEGVLSNERSLDNIVGTLCEKLDAECTVLPFGDKSIKRVAIVSGGASGELAEAIDKGIDCYVTGEPGHANYHEALEAKINVIYCGHYHSETPGVKALGKLIENQFGIETVFLDIPTVI